MEREPPAFAKRLTPHLVLFLLYVVLGRAGLAVHPVETFATYVWPGTALAIAALVLFGWKMWPAILLGAFAVNLSLGSHVLVALALAIGNTFEALIGAYIIKKTGLDTGLFRLRDKAAIIAASFVAPLAGASIATLNLIASGTVPSSAAPSLFLTWWMGDAIGSLVLLPFLLKWGSKPQFARKDIQYVEFALAMAAVFATALLVFWTSNNPYAYYLFIPLTWAALRTGPRGMTLALLIASVTALGGTLFGKGPYADSGLLPLQIFIGTMSLLFPIFVGVVEERKKAQQESLRHVEELEQALHKISSEDEAKKNFLAMLAHELRNPLAAMMSSVELLRHQGLHDESSPSLIRSLDEHVRAMRAMLDDVLDMSRISRNKLSLRTERMSLNRILERSIRAVDAFMRSRNHTFIVTKPHTDILVDADPIRLEQVLVNLLNNAAKYTGAKGKVELVIAADKKTVTIEVRDSGIGISRSMQKRIFEPFFQVTRGKLPTEGLGLGLSLTKQLVEMHGGTIEARSQGEGRGAQFIVTLPRAAGAAGAEPDPKLKTALRKVKHAHSILVVDDNEVAADTLAKLLSLRGHSVKVAHTGGEALKEAARQNPEIIILDIGLPDMTGYDVVRTLQSGKGFSSAVIALTGYGQTEDKEKAMDAGFNYHLTKPVGLKELERAFRKVSA